VRSAEATGRVNFRYDRAKPLSRLDGTAQRVVYDGQKQTVTLEGDVSLDGEDEFYIMRWRNNERIVVYLEEESQRVEAKAKERDGQPIGEMVIEPKRQKE
jgi:lipopolysaccharide export system protein LptA